MPIISNLNIQGRGFEIAFDGIRVYITLTEYYINKVIGLCGAYNLNSNDDFLAPNKIIESNVVTFSDYYKLNQNLPTPLQIAPCDLMITVTKNLIFKVQTRNETQKNKKRLYKTKLILPF